MSEYIVTLVLGVAGLAVLLLMNFIIIRTVFSHKDRFTGPLSRFYHRLGAFFIVLLCIQIIFPLYFIQLNFLRFVELMPAAALDIIFFERMYLGLFIIVAIAAFYIASKVLENMDKLVDAYSFSDKSQQKMTLRHIYFTPKKRLGRDTEK